PHQMRPIKRVAFEGIVTRRRFYGCPVQENGVNCGVVEWVDGPWPPVLQRCLSKLLEMFHEQNCGRVLDKEKFEKELAKLKCEHERELAKLKMENDKLCIEYTKLVDDVSKMFDWQDGRVDKMVYQKQVKEKELEKKELEEKAMLEV
uniref:Zinc finger GRF-type domain-containing protein n=1 Tax=Aegilops tauschii subsp. strangulata TaxID=200361 RepID=A0A453HNQ4_AEGTS